MGTVPKWHSKFRFQNGILSNVSVSDLLYLLYLYKYEAISQVACPPNAALSGFQLEVGRYQAFDKKQIHDFSGIKMVQILLQFCQAEEATAQLDECDQFSTLQVLLR